MYFIWVSAIIFTSAGGFSLLPAAAMTFFGNKNSKLKIGFLYISQGVGALLQVKANILSTFLIAHAMVGVVITCGSSKCYVKLQIYILGNCENAIQKRIFRTLTCRIKIKIFTKILTPIIP